MYIGFLQPFLQGQCIMENDFLQDKKNDKDNPWIPKKIRSLRVADSFKRLGHEDRSLRIRFCGSSLQFLKNLETGEKRLLVADFCKERLCPMCQWRKSLKVFHQVSRVMDVIEIEHKNLVPLFLTLTVNNCSGDLLSSEVDGVLKGWHHLLEHWTIRKVVKGWFRALEITYDDERYISSERYKKRKAEYDRKGIKAGDLNPNYDTFHPHIHAVVLVDKSYFKGSDYLETTDWVRLWRTALGVDYDPICDIRKVRNYKGKKKAVAEVAKYTLKDTDFVKADLDLMDKLVETLFYALTGRRLHAFGGTMKKVAKQIKLDDIEKGDLVNVSGEEFRKDVATVIEVYRWSFGVANYLYGGELPS